MNVVVLRILKSFFPKINGLKRIGLCVFVLSKRIADYNNIIQFHLIGKDKVGTEWYHLQGPKSQNTGVII